MQSVPEYYEFEASGVSGDGVKVRPLRAGESLQWTVTVVRE